MSAHNDSSQPIAMGYLPKPGDNTRYTYGTLSGEPIPIEGHITLIVDVDSVARMMDDGPVLVQINPGCITKHDEAVRRQLKEQAVKDRNALVTKIKSRVMEDFENQLSVLDKQAELLYDEIDSRVNSILASLESNQQ